MEKIEDTRTALCNRMGTINDEDRLAKKGKVLSILLREDGAFPIAIQDFIDDQVVFELAWLTNVYTKFRGNFDDWLKKKGFDIDVDIDDRNERDDRIAKKRKLLWILENENGELYGTCCMEGFLRDFIFALKNSIHNLLTQIREFEDEPSSGRDFSAVRDTEEQVENAVRFFPEVLSMRKEPLWVDDFEDQDESMGLYPIQIQTIYGYNNNRSGRRFTGPGPSNFIPLLARLAIEYNQFETGTRGGLLLEDKRKQNVLQKLASTRKVKEFKSWHYECIDAQYAQVFKQLEDLNLLKREDIAEYNLLKRVCKSNECFPEKRFAFLSDLDPRRLVQTDWPRVTPLHIVATSGSFRAFQLVFDAGMRHYPANEGIIILFRKDWWGRTPFANACKYERKVSTFVEEIMMKYSGGSHDFSRVFLSAASDDSISLDGVYFLLRRQPDMLKKLLSSVTHGGGDSQNKIGKEDNGTAPSMRRYNFKKTENCHVRGKTKNNLPKKRKRV